MPDQAPGSAPGSAPSGAGQADAGASTPGKAGAATETPAGFDPKAFTEGLTKSITEANKKAWDGIVSRTDKRLADFETRQRQARARPQADTEDYGFNDDPEPAPKGRRTTAATDDNDTPAQDHDRDIRDAVLGFRQENDDWRDILPQILEIGNDPQQAARFRVADSRGRVDYSASFERIREHLESKAARAQKAEADKAGQDKEAKRLKRDATISGSGASAPEEVDLSKMTKKQKLEWLYENHPEEFDENDLPSDLKGRRKR